MRLNRRHLAAVALVAAGPTLATPAWAAASDADQVLANVKAHRDALFNKDAKALDALSAPELSYSHSDAHIEDKATMITNATSQKSKWLSLSYEDITVRIVGDAAIARFKFVGENQAGEKKNQIALAILMNWQKQGGQWKLLSRASTKL